MIIVSSFVNNHFSFPLFISQLGSFLIFLAPLVFLRDSKAIQRVLITLLLASTWLEISTILSATGIIGPGNRPATAQGFGQEYFVYRTPGLITAFGDHAVLLSFAIPLTLHFLFLRPQKRASYLLKPILFLILLVLIIATIALQSRNVWISSSISVVIFILLWLFQKNRGNTKWRYFALASSAFLLAALVSSLQLFTDLVDFFIEIRPSSIETRLFGYQTGLALLGKNPVFGIGPFVYELLYDEHIHNFLLSIFLSGGLLAGFLMAITLVLLGTNMLAIWRDNPAIDEGPVIIAGYIGSLVAGMFYGQFASWFFWIILGLLLAYLNVYARSLSQEQPVHKPQIQTAERF